MVCCKDLSPCPSPQERGELLMDALSLNNASPSPAERGPGGEVLNTYRADLHVHTVLSPCGDIEMTPAFIIRRAKECGLDIVGITDHNSTLQCAEVRRIGEREGVFVLCGAEVTTQEEVHCLAFMEDMETLTLFQEYLSRHLPPIKNKPDLFGYQLIVNEREEVLGEAPYLLISALNQSIDQVEREVHRLGGLFIPAHIDKQKDSLLSQLGFVPPDLQVDALEISYRTCPDKFSQRFLSTFGMTTQLTDGKGARESTVIPNKVRNLISSSDAHYPDEFSRRQTLFHIGALTFDEIRKALHGKEGRSVEIAK